MHERPSPSLSRRKLLAMGIGAVAIITGSGGIWYISSRSGAPPSTLITPTRVPTAGTTLFTYTGHTDPVFSVAWSPDGKRIVSGSWDETAQVWDATKGTTPSLTYTGHIGLVGAVVWSPDSRRIASGGKDKTVQVWDATEGT